MKVYFVLALVSALSGNAYAHGLEYRVERLEERVSELEQRLESKWQCMGVCFVRDGQNGPLVSFNQLSSGETRMGAWYHLVAQCEEQAAQMGRTVVGIHLFDDIGHSKANPDRNCSQ